MTSAELKTAYSNLFIGRDEVNGRYFDGIIDEVGFWNRSLSQAEVTQLYNGGDGMTYTNVFNTPPDVTLNSPDDASTTATPTNTFNCSASDDVELTNVSLLINNSIVFTNTTGTNGTDYLFPYTLTGTGTYNWTCSATDNSNETTTETVRTLIYLDNSPDVTLNSPADAYNTVTPTIHLTVQQVMM